MYVGRLKYRVSFGGGREDVLSSRALKFHPKAHGKWEVLQLLYICSRLGEEHIAYPYGKGDGKGCGKCAYVMLMIPFKAGKPYELCI